MLGEPLGASVACVVNPDLKKVAHLKPPEKKYTHPALRPVG